MDIQFTVVVTYIDPKNKASVKAKLFAKTDAHAAARLLALIENEGIAKVHFGDALVSDAKTGQPRYRLDYKGRKNPL